MSIQEPTEMTRRWADLLQDDILLEWALQLPRQPHIPRDHVTHLPHRSDLAFDSHYCETHLRTMEDRHDFPKCATSLCGAITNKFVPPGTYGPSHPERLSDYLSRMLARAERRSVSVALGLHLPNSQRSTRTIGMGSPQKPSENRLLCSHQKH